ncbi:MAG: DUF1565 domain-containing protein [Planctomycetota bacterium]
MIGETLLLLLALNAMTSTLPSSLAIDDYYVDQATGNDSTGTGTSESPWKTITHALTQARQVGDRVFVRPGTYDSLQGEVFPLVPASGVDLISTNGPEVTRIHGEPSQAVVSIQNTLFFVSTEIQGFSIENGSDGIAVHDTSGAYFVTLTNNTITKNTRAGVYTGTRLGSEGGNIVGCRIAENRWGFYDYAQTGNGGWNIRDSAIVDNTSHGVVIKTPPAPVFWPPSESFRVERSTISNNGGIGWTQKIEPFIKAGSDVTLLNSTISGNAGGGLYTRADYYWYYIPYWGYQCFDPEARIDVTLSTVANNGGFGGAMRAGTSYRSNGSLGLSIAWGNSGLDNVNFYPVRSDIGTGFKSGLGVFSEDPRFIDSGGGDFRLRSSSPCIDRRPLPGTNGLDFEGEQRGYDGDGNGENQDDVGADEFRTLVFPGTVPLSGQPFWFEAQAPPTEDGHLVAVLLSRSKAGPGGGIPVPGSGGRTADLEADSLFAFGLGNLPFLQATFANQKALTPPSNLPGAGFAHPIFYAGVSLDLTGGQIVSITPTHSFVIQ